MDAFVVPCVAPPPHSIQFHLSTPLYTSTTLVLVFNTPKMVLQLYYKCIYPNNKEF